MAEFGVPLFRQLALLQQQNRQGPLNALGSLGQGIQQGTGAIADQLRLLSQNQRQDQILKDTRQHQRALQAQRGADDLAVQGVRERSAKGAALVKAGAAQAAQRNKLLLALRTEEGKDFPNQPLIGELKRRIGAIDTATTPQGGAQPGTLSPTEKFARGGGGSGSPGGPGEDAPIPEGETAPAAPAPEKQTGTLRSRALGMLTEAGGTPGASRINPGQATRDFVGSGTRITPPAPAAPVQHIAALLHPKEPSATQAAALHRRLANPQVIEPTLGKDGKVTNPARDPAARYYQEIAKIVIQNKSAGNRLSLDELTNHALDSARNNAEMRRIVGGQDVLRPLPGVFITPQGVEVNGRVLNDVEISSLRDRFEIVHVPGSGRRGALDVQGERINGKLVVPFGSSPVRQALPALAKVSPIQKRPEFAEQFIRDRVREIWEAYQD